VVAVLAAVFAAAATPVATADAARRPSGKCPARPGTVAKSRFGRVWHRGSSLYGCANKSRRSPKAVRLGPWAPGSKVALRGTSVAWTVPRTGDGLGSDRLWAASIPRGRWLRGAALRPATATAPRGEARIQRLLVDTDGVGWVTRDGDVALALRSPSGDFDPQPVGPLPAALTPRRNLLLVGSWPDADPAALAGTAKLAVSGEERDDCGGIDRYTLTVRPDPTAPRVGAVWRGLAVTASYC
jgi:hypothetical protein